MTFHLISLIPGHFRDITNITLLLIFPIVTQDIEEIEIKHYSLYLRLVLSSLDKLGERLNIKLFKLNKL